MKKTDKKITVIWKDAVIFNPASGVPEQLPTIETLGTLVELNKKFILIKNTRSKVSNRKTKLEKDKARFYFIPTGMITKIIK